VDISKWLCTPTYYIGGHVPSLTGIVTCLSKSSLTDTKGLPCVACGNSRRDHRDQRPLQWCKKLRTADRNVGIANWRWIGLFEISLM